MKLATTTGDFELYCKTYKERIRHIYEAGFRYIDLSLYTVMEDDELLIASDWRKNAERLKAFAEGLGMQFHIRWESLILNNIKVCSWVFCVALL